MMPTKHDVKLIKPNTDTPPSEENRPDTELTELEQLRKQVALQDKLIKGLQQAEIERSKSEPGFGGYLVHSPVKTYNGSTAGVQFRNGTALIPLGPGAAEKAEQLRTEFHYEVALVTDWRNLGEAPELGSRMTDIL